MDWKDIKTLFVEPLFSLGETQVSLATLMAFVLILVIVVLLSRITRVVLLKRVLSHTKLDTGMQYLISRMAGYVVLALGLMVGLQTIGINLNSLTIFAGAVGIGVGFGLQTIVNNFVSGIIIMGERAVQVGDRVEVGDTLGDVVRIGARSTSIRTNDNIIIIVPNADFVSGRVVNWSHRGDTNVRMRIPVGVSYDSDPHKVRKLLLEVAEANPQVLQEPPPNVVFRGFGDSSLDFELRVWTSEMTHRPGAFKSALNFALWDKFKEHKIEIPFPQRDVHVKEPLKVELKQ